MKEPQYDEPKFTDQDFADWKAFERVRAGGKWNMFSTQAWRASKLSDERYSFVMQWYSELKAAVEAKP